jgi:hypothetical protein
MKKWLIVLIIVVIFVLLVLTSLYFFLIKIPQSVPEECKGLGGKEWGDCINNLAIEKNSPSICKKSMYYNDCYYNLAILNRDISICKKMDEGFQIKCYGAVENSVNYCNQNYQGDEKNICLFGIADGNLDASACLNIGSRNFILNCIELIKDKKQEASICEEIRKIDTSIMEDLDLEEAIDQCKSDEY